MSLETLQHALQELPNSSAILTGAQVKKLAKLIDGDQPLQPFLEQLLPQLCEIFSAVAGVAWLRAYAAQGAIFGVPHQMDRVIQTALDQKKHEKLVQLAWQQRQPMLAEPQSLSTRKGAASNPTSHALLFGPIMHFGEPIALVELVLQEFTQPPSPEQKKLFLRSIQLIGERVYSGLRQRMALPGATIGQAVEQVRSLSEEIGDLQQQICSRIESRVQQFHGWAFGSLEENQRFAKMIHQLLDNHGLRVECPECHNPSILRCLRAGNAKHGVFVYDHYLDSGRTFHGGPTTVPLLRVVNKPVRRTAVSNEE
jgi:hypothetical protein